MRGQATLRLAFCGTHVGCNVEAFLNDRSIGETGTLPSTSAMQRDGIRAYWIEKDIGFDAALMKQGTNVIKLLSHANSWSQGGDVRLPAPGVRARYSVTRMRLVGPASSGRY